MNATLPCKGNPTKELQQNPTLYRARDLSLSHSTHTLTSGHGCTSILGSCSCLAVHFCERHILTALWCSECLRPGRREGSDRPCRMVVKACMQGKSTQESRLYANCCCTCTIRTNIIIIIEEKLGTIYSHMGVLLSIKILCMYTYESHEPASSNAKSLSPTQLYIDP